MGIDKKCFRIQREGDDSNGEAKERVRDGF